MERIGFAAMAVLTLAPVFFQALWLMMAVVLRAEGDGLWLTVASLVVAAGAVAAQILFQKRIFLRSNLLAAAIGLCAAFLLAGSLQSWLAMALAFLILGVLASSLMTWLVRKLPHDIDGSAGANKVKAILFLLISAFSIWKTAELSVFMGDARRVEHSAIPDIEFLKNHSCLTAYVHAMKLANAKQANLYDASLWPDENLISESRGLGPDTSGPYAPFFLDNYMYPPQFLLLPAALLGFSEDFLIQRAIWFGFCGIMLAMAFYIVAMWAGEKGKRHGLWMLPVLWSSIVIIVTLQVGNVHHVVIAMGLLAMVAFDLKKPAWGGAMLAFAILSKVSPGILIIVLLVQRRWRDLAWTLGFGLMFTFLTLVFFGSQPIAQFLSYQLPRLLSGESMKWFASSDTNIVINSGPFGIPFKLSLLGMTFEDIWGTARLINMIFTLSIVGITVWGARRQANRSGSLYLWLGILILSSLQSPFSPGYVLMPALWLLSLLVVEVKNIAGLVLFSITWFVLAFPIPGTAAINVILGFLQLALVMAVIVYAIRLKHHAQERLAA